ncbi:ABC transporter, partial [Bifidobacteriaceae bacterium NR026]
MVDFAPSANVSGSVPVFGANTYDATNEDVP